MLLLAEDLLLLLTDDTSGRLSVPSSEVDVLLVGANLVELTLMGKVDLSREMRRDRFRFFELGDPKWGRIIVRDPSPTGDEVLDATLEFAIAFQGRLPPAVIWRLSKYHHQTLYWRLARRGMVHYKPTRHLGPDRWQVHYSAYGAEVRRRVTQALVAGTPPDTQSAALIALMHTIRCEPKIVDPRLHGMSPSQLFGRAEEIAGSNWAPEAIRSSIDAWIAATGSEAARARG